MIRKFFNHEQFNFELQFALGGVHYGAGDIGDMLSTADRVVDGDADSWCREWIATGQRLAAIAERLAKSGHSVSARAAYLRAATYYAVALSSVDGTTDPAALLCPTFAEHRRCFDAYAELLDPPAERVEIPYEVGTMPGYLFRPSTSDMPRRTLIMNNGSDGPVTSIWPPVSAGGVARGYNVLIFDGPGQHFAIPSNLPRSPLRRVPAGTASRWPDHFSSSACSTGWTRLSPASDRAPPRAASRSDDLRFRVSRDRVVDAPAHGWVDLEGRQVG